MDMNHVREKEDPTFNSFSAIGEAVCTIAEGMIATVQYVVGVIKGGGRHSSQCRSGESGEESLSLVSHTAPMNSPNKSSEQSTKGRHGYPKSKPTLEAEINDETLTVGGNSRNGGSVQPRYRKRETTKL